LLILLAENAAIARRPQWADIIISFQWLIEELLENAMLHPLKMAGQPPVCDVC
jgi:hypothetical protein